MSVQGERCVPAGSFAKMSFFTEYYSDRVHTAVVVPLLELMIGRVAANPKSCRSWTAFGHDLRNSLREPTTNRGLRRIRACQMRLMA